MDFGASSGGKRRVMVVADPGRESAGALEWALYHAVLEHDEIILLHVHPTPHAAAAAAAAARRATTLSSILRRPPSTVASTNSASFRSENGGGCAVEHEFLDAMRGKCEAAQPKVKVHVERVASECKEKAATILLQTKLMAIDLLVVGQRRNSPSFLGCRLSGSTSSKGPDPAEFLIENSKCLCVAVQKKGQNAGYVLNTKTHKNFWLLA